MIRRAFFSGLIIVAALLLGDKSAKAGYPIEEPPSWVGHVAVPEASKPGKSDERVDVQQLLVDEQDHYGEQGLEAYRHYARRILTAAGVENVADITIEFDPGFQRLVLHHVTVHREGVAKDVLAASQIRTVNAQPDQSARMYDDTVAVHVLLNDVRVGDTVEYAYTRVGQNPVLEGHVLSSFTLGRSVAVRRLLQKVMYPDHLTATFKVHGTALTPARSARAGFVEYSWSLDDVAAVAVEDETPDWFDPYPWVQVSDFASWSDVAKWAATLYDKPARLGPEIEARLEGWNREPDAEKRLAQAVRFVQDEVRYLGLEIGPNSFEPHEPAAVLAQRYGDCKDKSLLLVALLTRLGIEAHPALVASSGGPVVADLLPSPYAFDHVIVRARIGLKPYFFDPTLRYQRGTADLIQSPDYGYALVISRDTRGLEKLDVTPPAKPLVEVVETYRLRGSNPIVDFSVETELRGAEAARIRERFASDGPTHIQKEYENFYVKLFRSVAATSPLQHVDDESSGTFKIMEHYRIDHFWNEGKRTVLSWAVRNPLSKPDVIKRRQPFAVQHPSFVRHTVVVDWDEPAEYAIEPLTLRGAALSFRREGTASGGRLAMTYELRTLKDHVTPAEAAAHFALVDRLLDETAYELTSRSTAATAGPEIPRAVWITGGVMLGTASTAIGVRLLRRRRRLQAFKRKPGKGETAATALLVEGKPDAVRIMSALRCGCGSTLREVSETPDPIRYGDRLLVVFEGRCPQCGANAKRYFEIETSETVSA